MRIVYATYPWAFETPGGGEIQLLKYEEYLRAAGVEIVRYDSWSKGLVGADLVHFFSCIGGSVHFCSYVKSRGLPLVVSSSLWLTEETKHRYPLGEIGAQLGLADVIVTNGDVESDRLASIFGIDRGRFLTIRNACDPIFAQPTDPKLFRQRFSIGEPFLLNVGNVEPRKNQLNLIRAAKSLGHKLVVIGHVRAAEYAQACWAEGGADVRYLGAIDHHDPLLRSAYAGCAAFCLPSTLETPGLAALEAAAAGARLVVTGEGSTREYFGDEAYYVASGDIGDIAAKIATALASPASPLLQRRVAQHLTWDRAVEPLAAFYRSLTGPHLAQRPGRRPRTALIE